jgi:polyphosphate kinase
VDEAMLSNSQIENRITVASAAPARATATRAETPEKVLLNRELSQIEFFRQVLAEAMDARNPLLERLRFLIIFSNIVDEFFMIRVSGLKDEAEDGWGEPSPDGLTPEEQLREIRNRLRPMIEEQTSCLTQEILPALAAKDIVVASYSSLSTSERAGLDAYFARHVFPVLTPLAVDPAHPFPYISGLSLNLAVMVQSSCDAEESDARFVRLKVPPVLPGLVPIENEKNKFIFLSEIISANLGSLFPGMRAGQDHPFRVTRDADIDVREEDSDDLLNDLQKELRKRRFGSPVRLEVASSMPDEMASYITEALGLAPEDVYRIEGPLNVADLISLCELNRPDLRYRPLRTTVPAALKDRRSIFDVIKRGDVLLHHPYTAYSTVTNFVRAAADDPNVLAIKICLYRTGQQSKIAETLVRAGEQGKQVTALVELKARFDEENNIEWARRLDRAGVHVVYGLIGLKTHSKFTLIVRREDGVLRRYVHVATGNYTPTSSSTYTDLGLLTADEEIGADATDLFNYLTGYSKQEDYRRLLIAPVNLREKLTALIDRETAQAEMGRPARIIAKLNRLADPAIIRTLYDASDAGVSIDLIVRSICLLRPGVPGLSENIRVRSIVGRFLEHSRILYFANGGDEEVYIGSADWMPRNLDRRVEVVCPINDPRLRDYLKQEVLGAYLRDNVNARVLLPDGFHERVRPGPRDERFDSQISFEGKT